MCCPSKKTVWVKLWIFVHTMLLFQLIQVQTQCLVFSSVPISSTDLLNIKMFNGYATLLDPFNQDKDFSDTIDNNVLL